MVRRPSFNPRFPQYRRDRCPCSGASACRRKRRSRSIPVRNSGRTARVRLALRPSNPRRSDCSIRLCVGFAYDHRSGRPGGPAFHPRARCLSGRIEARAENQMMGVVPMDRRLAIRRTMAAVNSTSIRKKLYLVQSGAGINYISVAFVDMRTNNGFLCMVRGSDT
jgi:hypothetical protein